ncbi:MAG TPA: carbamoyltransferase HypF [Polyangiaceae bacterium]
MRLAIVVRGTVQGVGFRPFVHQAAARYGLSGWVKNGRDAVRLEVQGGSEQVASFERALAFELPPPAEISELSCEHVPEREEIGFRIMASDADAPVDSLLPPDLALCADCWREVETPGDRRHRYPFTNCARCGPRYSIAEALPYDRENTSMRVFEMCKDCAAEYENIADRRHHAQPIACPRCGPELSWISRKSEPARGKHALARAAHALASGQIVALRGIGGFQLLVDATNAAAVARLRTRKHRPHKPFAVMFRDERALAESARVTDAELAALRGTEAPIVLVRRHDTGPLCSGVCAQSPYVGALLPYSPLHGLLLAEVGRPLVCTSGNLSNEPICITIAQAQARLSDIADGFLTHNRPIVRPLDDSVVQLSRRGPVVLRRARGFAPRTVARIQSELDVLAVGAHMKSTLTIAHRGALIPSQHLGDLESPETRALFERTLQDLCAFLDARPERIACDLHPEYASSRLAERLAAEWQVPLIRVQHHHAHIAACMAEHALDGAVLGLAWDGVGLGSDGTIWGGEALVCEGASFRRFAQLPSFPLPGGDRASREPERAALGALFELAPDQLELYGRRWFGAKLGLQIAALERGLNSPFCSSAGRLFDAVAALLGVCELVTFEGQAAIALESLAAECERDTVYPCPLSQDAPASADGRLLLAGILADIAADVPVARIARRFHDTLIELGVAIAQRAGLPRVVLSGGCFQNRLLLEGLEQRLAQEGFSVYAPQRVPANDGGISVGQAFVAAQT